MASNDGYFTVHRKIFEHGLWQYPIVFRVFLYILGKAVYAVEGVSTGNILVKRGQYLRSFRKLQEDLQYVENRQIKVYSTSTIKNAVDKLINMQIISAYETELGTLFTIINYDKYQRKPAENDTSTPIIKDDKSELGTELRTTAEQPANNNNKNNKDKNKYAQKFEQFWSLYPKKVSKIKAETIFKKLKPGDELFNKIINALNQQVKSEQWTKDNGQYIPYPTTWLSQERWNDELTIEEIARKPKVWNLDDNNWGR